MSKHAARTSRDDKQSLIGEARRLFQNGQAGAAESLLNSVLQRDPTNLHCLMALAIIAAESQQPDLAAARLEKVLKVQPSFAPALCWMSSLAIDRGNPSEGVSFARRAVAAEPMNPGPHAALARALAESKMLEPAITSYYRAIDLGPGNAALHYQLADLLLTLQRNEAAARLLRTAVEIAPEPWALLRLAFLELGIGNLDSAEKYGRRALRADPSLAQFHVLMGRIRTEQMRFEEAEECWRLAQKMEPKPGFVNLDKAVSLATVGKFADALDELRLSIDAQPRQGSAYQMLVFAKRVTAKDLPLVEQMESVLSDGLEGPTDRVNLLYALGKAHDNLGNYDKAISFFDRANELKREVAGLPTFDRNAFKASIDAKIELFTPEFLAKFKTDQSPSDLPILVVGMMRSGTTLVEQLLTCHPKIGGAGEQAFWAEQDQKMVDYNTHSIDKDIARRSASGYVRLLESISPGTEKVVDKNPANLLVLGSLNLALPNARVIHTLRSPIDTALSIWMTPMNTSAPFICDRSNVVFAYKQYTRLMNHWRKVLPKDRFVEVAYEDLVSEPEVHVPELVSFIGVDWDEACLHPENNSRRVLTPSFWQVRQPIYKTSSSKWKNYAPWLGEFNQLLEEA